MSVSFVALASREAVTQALYSRLIVGLAVAKRHLRMPFFGDIISNYSAFRMMPNFFKEEWYKLCQY